MTAQAPDHVLFEENWFAVTAVDGEGLFAPAEHGLEPRWTGTGCYRGFICSYAVVEQRLILRDLALGSADEPPALGGVQPWLDGDGRRDWHYQGLGVPVAFTGRLLIGAGDVADRPYLNMGFWPAWMFGEVHELTFRAGALLTATDCSAALAEVRADLVALGVGPDVGEPSGDWVDRTFSLTYDYSWPGRRQRSRDSAQGFPGGAV